MPVSFVHTHGAEYREATTSNLMPWFSFAVDTMTLFHSLKHPILVVDSAVSYLTRGDISADLAKGNPLKVWRGGMFAADHPMNEKDPKTGHCIHILARAVHDIIVHHELGHSFEPSGELWGALASRKHYSALSLPALWTDDVAMGCMYAHYGEWPKIQRPVICTPDWEGLEEYLKGAR